MNLEAREKLANVLKELRGSETFTDFGKRLGVSYAAVSKWENCLSEPDTENLTKIAKLAGYRLDEFINMLNGKPTVVTGFNVEDIVDKIRVLPLKQLALVEKAMSERLFTIAESTGR